MTQRLVVGRIVKPHGIRGEVIVEPQTEAPNVRFAPGARVFAGDPDGKSRELRIVAVRPHQDWFIVQLSGVTDRDRAEGMRNLLLSVPVSEARPPEPGRYYPHQLEGLDVVDEEGALLGVLVGVEEYPANDLWVVRRPNGADVLVPAVTEFILRIDLATGRVVIRPIPGLFEDDEG